MCEHCEENKWQKEIEDLKDIKGFHKIAKPLGDRPYEDLTGQKFGRLTPIRAVGRTKSDSKTLWYCECDCSGKVIIEGTNLKQLKVASCGCAKKDKGKNLRDLTGQKFGELTVVKRADDHIEKDGRGRVQWECSCSCGG